MRPASYPARRIPAPIRRIISGSFVADETEFNIFNSDRKLAALEDAARRLSHYPEKKALVYISSGIQKTGVDNQSQLQATVNAAIRANVAFYPIDARGLMATPPGGDASQAASVGSNLYSGSAQTSLMDNFHNTPGNPGYAGRRYGRQGAARFQRSDTGNDSGAE